MFGGSEHQNSSMVTGGFKMSASGAGGPGLIDRSSAGGAMSMGNAPGSMHSPTMMGNKNSMMSNR